MRPDCPPSLPPLRAAEPRAGALAPPPAPAVPPLAAPAATLPAAPPTAQPAPQPAAARIPAPRRLTSAQLLAGATEVQIEHRGAMYRLRLTSLDKLILTK